jgi:hypothetical protein
MGVKWMDDGLPLTKAQRARQDAASWWTEFLEDGLPGRWAKVPGRFHGEALRWSYGSVLDDALGHAFRVTGRDAGVFRSRRWGWESRGSTLMAKGFEVSFGDMGAVYLRREPV